MFFRYSFYLLFFMCSTLFAKNNYFYTKGSFGKYANTTILSRPNDFFVVKRDYNGDLVSDVTTAAKRVSSNYLVATFTKKDGSFFKELSVRVKQKNRWNKFLYRLDKSEKVYRKIKATSYLQSVSVKYAANNGSKDNYPGNNITGFKPLSNINTNSVTTSNKNQQTTYCDKVNQFNDLFDTSYEGKIEDDLFSSVGSRKTCEGDKCVEDIACEEPGWSGVLGKDIHEGTYSFINDTPFATGPDLDSAETSISPPEELVPDDTKPTRRVVNLAGMENRPTEADAVQENGWLTTLVNSFLSPAQAEGKAPDEIPNPEYAKTPGGGSGGSAPGGSTGSSLGGSQSVPTTKDKKDTTSLAKATSSKKSTTGNVSHGSREDVAQTEDSKKQQTLNNSKKSKKSSNYVRNNVLIADTTKSTTIGSPDEKTVGGHIRGANVRASGSGGSAKAGARTKADKSDVSNKVKPEQRAILSASKSSGSSKNAVTSSRSKTTNPRSASPTLSSASGTSGGGASTLSSSTNRLALGSNRIKRNAGQDNEGISYDSNSKSRRSRSSFSGGRSSRNKFSNGNRTTKGQNFDKNDNRIAQVSANKKDTSLLPKKEIKLTTSKGTSNAAVDVSATGTPESVLAPTQGTGDKSMQQQKSEKIEKTTTMTILASIIALLLGLIFFIIKKRKK